MRAIHTRMAFCINKTSNKSLDQKKGPFHQQSGEYDPFLVNS